MSRATASPVIQTEREPIAHGAARMGLLALVQSVWGSRHLPLVALVAGLCSAILVLGASDAKHVEAGAQLHSGGSQSTFAAGFLVELTETLATVGENPTELERGSSPEVCQEFNAAEFEQEDEEEQSKGLAQAVVSTPNFAIFRDDDDRLVAAVSTFVTRISDFRELPRGPPSLS